MAKKTESSANITVADLGVNSGSKVDAMKPYDRPVREIKKSEVLGERSKSTIVVEEYH